MTECLDKIANIMINYYKPFRMIEYKYKEKVTAIGLLKKAQMGFPNYLLPYYEKLMDYKLLIKDHTDNLKMAHNIAMEMFKNILQDVFRDGIKKDNPKSMLVFNYIIALLFPQYQNADQKILEEMKQLLLTKYNSPDKIRLLAEKLLTRHLDIEDKYDLLAKIIVNKCLSGITLEDVSKINHGTLYNFYVYGIFSKSESRNIYNVNVQVKNEIRSLKFFTKIKLLAWAVMNMVSNYEATINFFGNIFDDRQEIEKLFSKNSNIILNFY